MFYFHFLPGVYEAKSLPDVIGSFKNTRKTNQPLIGAQRIISTKSFVSSELTLRTMQKLVTMLLDLEWKKSNVPSYWKILCSISFKDLFNELIAVFKRVYDINHRVNKESLLIVSPSVYILKGELVSSKWRYHTYRRSKNLFTKKGKSDYHFEKKS